MRTRYLIAADGMSAPGHLENRHFLELEGEKLLPRTVRQFSRKGRVTVVAPPEYAAQLPGTNVVQMPRKPLVFFGNDMIAKTEQLWSRKGRTVILFGDVWYSDDAVSTITKFKAREFQTFGRRQSSIAGTPWGEIFAFSFWPEHHKEIMSALYGASLIYKGGQWSRCSPWEFYYLMEGMDLGIPNVQYVPIGPSWTNINDWTDDFDFKGEAERWIARRRLNGYS